VPQRLDGTPHSTGWPTFSPDSELDTLVRAQPLRSTTTHGAPADLTNVVLVGSHDEVAAAFAAAGWTPASEANLKADFRTFIATMEQRKYARAPVFNLLLDGKLPQFVFEKQTDTFAKRHHVRLYAPAVSYKGAPVWVATGTHDIGIGSNAADTSWFHRIDTHVDRERTKIVNDLMFSGFTSVYGFVDRPGTPPKLRNATGDDMYTDGRVAVVLLKSVPARE
jgi:LssY C-terminus